MDTSEVNVHPFVVRIWVEEKTDEVRRTAWRGQITHVPSGERRTFSHLSDMNAFIVPYLESMGVRPTLWQQVRQRLGALRR